MSQMGNVIREVNKLFNDRGEQVLAQRRDEKLFGAAKEFKSAVDDFEAREKERVNDAKKRNQGR